MKEINLFATSKQKFFAGESEHPMLDYPKLDSSQLAARERELVAFKREIVQQESDPLVRQLYRWRLNEKIAENRMLMAVGKGDLRRFQRYTEFIYGKPSTDVFRYTVQTVREEAERSLTSDDETLRRAARQLLIVLPEAPATSGDITLPDQETVQKAHDQTHREFGDLIAIPTPLDTPLMAEDIRVAMEQALQHVKAEGWTSVVDPKAKSVSASQEKKQIRVPHDRRVFHDRLQELIVHEVETHVNRRVRGERNRLMLLELGLDRYEGGEEGVATMREKAIKGMVKRFEGLDKYLAISFVTGLDGTSRNFREVFPIMEAYYAFRKAHPDRESDDINYEPAERAWNTCV